MPDYARSAAVYREFLLRHLPDIVTRFVEGRVATPNPVPQPAFLGRLAK